MPALWQSKTRDVILYNLYLYLFLFSLSILDHAPLWCYTSVPTRVKNLSDVQNVSKGSLILDLTANTSTTDMQAANPLQVKIIITSKYINPSLSTQSEQLTLK